MKVKLVPVRRTTTPAKVVSTVEKPVESVKQVPNRGTPKITPAMLVSTVEKSVENTTNQVSALEKQSENSKLVPTENQSQASTGRTIENKNASIEKNNSTVEPSGFTERFVMKKQTSKGSNKESDNDDDAKEDDDDETSGISADHDHGYSQADLSEGKKQPIKTTKWIRKCVARNCNNSGDRFPDLKFFRFPVRDDIRYVDYNA